jgi:uncharacterized pyridoxal phosphate-containing UPF0001 family protein
VHSSDEDTKYGVPKEQLSDLIGYILKECPYLDFKGLMTIGKLHDIEGFKVIININSIFEYR